MSAAQEPAQAAATGTSVSRRGVPVEESLRALTAGGRKLLVTYVTGGLGRDWLGATSAMIDAGADLVEIGIPFSDPVMDGPTIQEASLRALQSGANPASILDELAGLDAPVPLVAMTYYNLVAHAGHTRFASMLTQAGVTGAIVPDLPLEESGEWEADAAREGVATVMLAAPVTPDERLARICERSRGFVYGVNLMGVTGERASVSESAGLLARRLKALTDKPVVMGFGVSGPSQAAAIAEHADGVVVASALMRMLLEGEGPAAVAAAVAALRRSLDGG